MRDYGNNRNVSFRLIQTPALHLSEKDQSE